MAKKNTGLVIGAVVVLGLGAYLVAGTAAAADDGRDDGDDDLPTTGKPGTGKPGTPGKGPGGSPKTTTGGKTYGDPPSNAGYLIPEAWDPVRGLWIAPDCEMVVEAPGWYCGANGDQPNPYGGYWCNGEQAETLEQTMLIEGNGAAGFIDHLLELDWQPEAIAYEILIQASPLCADLPDDAWPLGLAAWYEGLLERVLMDWEKYWGIPFEPGEAA